MLTYTLLAATACALCFFAGRSWRDRRHERVENVMELAIRGFGERLERVEEILKLSND